MFHTVYAGTPLLTQEVQPTDFDIDLPTEKRPSYSNITPKLHFLGYNFMTYIC